MKIPEYILDGLRRQKEFDEALAARPLDPNKCWDETIALSGFAQVTPRGVYTSRLY